MRCMAVAVVGILLLSGPALGAAGDVLTVTGDRVNVRSGPGTEHAIIRQVSRHQRLIEIARQGDWVHAEVVGAEGAEGWVHASLVAPASNESPVPQATTGPASVAGEAAPPLQEATDAAAREPGPLAPETVAPGPAEPVDLQRFRDTVAYLNSRSMLIGGAELFTEVEPLGGGAVQVGAGEAWASIPPAGQRSYAVTLLDRWAAATGRSGEVKVQIVDDAGQVLMEESRP
jgi:uncharacterized protein YraI